MDLALGQRPIDSRDCLIVSSLGIIGLPNDHPDFYDGVKATVMKIQANVFVESIALSVDIGIRSLPTASVIVF